MFRVLVHLRLSARANGKSCNFVNARATCTCRLQSMLCFGGYLCGGMQAENVRASPKLLSSSSRVQSKSPRVISYVLLLTPGCASEYRLHRVPKGLLLTLTLLGESLEESLGSRETQKKRANTRPSSRPTVRVFRGNSAPLEEPERGSVGGNPHLPLSPLLPDPLTLR